MIDNIAYGGSVISKMFYILIQDQWDLTKYTRKNQNQNPIFKKQNQGHFHALTC